MNRKVRYRLGLNESQRALRDTLLNFGDFTIHLMMKEVRSSLFIEECWPNNPMSVAMPYFTIQKLASETGISIETVDKYAHAFIGITQEDPAYRSKRVSFDHKDAPLIVQAEFTISEGDDGPYCLLSGYPFQEIIPRPATGFADENGNEILIEDPMPHRILSARNALFCILAPTKVRGTHRVLRAIRQNLTERYSLPLVNNEKVDDAPHRIYDRETTEERRSNPLFDILSQEEPQHKEPTVSQQELFETEIQDPIGQAEREVARWERILRRLREFDDMLTNFTPKKRAELLQVFFLAECGS